MIGDLPVGNYAWKVENKYIKKGVRISQSCYKFLSPSDTYGPRPVGNTGA